MRNLISSIIYLCLLSCRGIVKETSKHEFSKAGVDSTTITIDSIYNKISKNAKIEHEKFFGRFAYIESDEKNERYEAQFVSSNLKDEIFYYSNSNANKKDTLLWSGYPIVLQSKINPLSIEIYKLFVREKKYILLTAESQSASGSGVEVTFFVLFELNKKNLPFYMRQFESRFGNVNSLVDLKHDGVLDYLKISRLNENGEFNLKILRVIDDKLEINGSLMLKYRLNDRFLIISDSLTNVL